MTGYCHRGRRRTGSPPEFAKQFGVRPEAGIQPVGDRLVILQVIGKQAEGLFTPDKALVDPQGKGIDISDLPAGGLHVDQSGQPAGIQVTQAAQQLQPRVFGQMFQAVSNYGHVVTLPGDRFRQGNPADLIQMAVMALAVGCDGGQRMLANAQQAPGGTVFQQGGQCLLGSRGELGHASVLMGAGQKICSAAGREDGYYDALFPLLQSLSDASMLSAELKARIQGAYSAYLEARSLKPRYGQRLMIAEVARGLGNIPVDDEGVRQGEPAVVAVEAGTGTGKTVAYSLAAIPLARAAEKRLVIATATVALQEQIVNKDLPDLLRNSGLSFSFALAKGRGRYLCVSRLDLLLQEGHAQSSTAQLFAGEGFNIAVDEACLALFGRMLERLSANRWDGDRDSWPETLEDQAWARVTVDQGQCTGRHCPNYQQCPFFRAREGMAKVDVIVTNHDMVLADLALGGGAVLPGPRQTLYVFDEGHHLPDKAIGHFAHQTRLRATADWLGQTERHLGRLLLQPAAAGALAALIENTPGLLHELRGRQQEMVALCEQLADFRGKGKEDSGSREWSSHRFPGGLVPEPLREAGLALKKGFAGLVDSVLRVIALLKESLDEGGTGAVAAPLAEEWYPFFGGMLARAEGNQALWAAFTQQDEQEQAPLARWLTRLDSPSGLDIEVSASPILAADTLRRSLWNVAYGALVTSATLTALNSFDRFRMRAGLPASAVTTVVPSPFRHAEMAVLRVPELGADPRDASAHTGAIRQLLPELLASERGALVLFSSRRQMQEVFEGLERGWQSRVLVQGRLSRQETLKQHRTRVDEGTPSVLFGLASFAEGLDLPGAYCEHVVIARIPFAVPDDPVEAALAEWIESRGGNPFMEITVPDASLRLIQACGRLLRTEQDRGTVTVLDRRLVTQRYGRAILAALPPFRQDIR